MEASGRLHTIFDTKQVSERFSKREFVVEMSDNPKYPQTVLFQLTGDRCTQLDGMNVGDQVSIEFSLRGREWKSPSGDVKYFNSLDVWQINQARAGAGGNRSRRGSYNGDARDVPPNRDFEPRPSDMGGPRSLADDDIPF